jgi:acyl-coenzyme A synthetase/AMP-(fatty) acid ligase/thioesterase domain-containing protein/acyl carrier protein
VLPDEFSGTVGERFYLMVDRHRDELAVTDDSRRLTFGQLERLVDQAAHAVEAMDPDHERPNVGVLTDQSVDAVVAFLATVVSSRATIPFGPEAPVERIVDLVDQAGPAVILTTAAHAHRAPDGMPVVRLDELGEPDDADLERLPITATHDDTVAITFTSGSTGRPKGAARSHRSRLQAVERNMRTNGYGPGVHGGNVFEYTSAAYAGSLWFNLLAGGSMALRDVRHSGGKGLARWLDEERVQRLLAPAALVDAMLDDDPPAGLLEHLEVVTFTGDALPTQTARRLLTHLTPGSDIRSIYGSSETGGIAEVRVDHDTPLEGEIVPTGSVYPHVTVRIAEPDGRGIGEIEASTHALSKGYVDPSAGHDDAFFTDPDGTPWFRSGDLGRLLPDGRLELHGRLDFRVKIRSQTIDPSEVERAILRLPGVLETCVVPRPLGRDGDLRLVAYVVPQDGASLSTSAVRRGLREHIPGWMIPQAVVSLDRLPRTIRGKPDRQAMPTPPAGRPDLDVAYAAPSSTLERRVAAAFAQVLELDGTTDVGRDDDFFDLGGDSLLAVSVTVLLGTEGIEVPLSLFVDAPTPAAIAAAIEAGADLAGSDGRIVALQTDGDGLPVYGVHAGAGRILNQLAFAARTAGTSPWFGIQMHESEKARDMFRPKAQARRYADELESWWAQGGDDGGPTADRPIILSGYSAGAAVAHALAVALRSRGHAVAAVFLIDPVTPGRRPVPHRRKQVLFTVHALSGRAPALHRVAPQRMAVSGLGAGWYRGDVLDVPMVLFQAERGNADPDVWAGLTSLGLEVVPVPGDHHTITEPPDANALGDALAAAARAAAASVGSVTPAP